MFKSNCYLFLKLGKNSCNSESAIRIGLYLVMLPVSDRCSICFMKLELSYLVTISSFLNIYGLLFELLKMVGMGEILQIFNFVDNCSKDFLHIVHNEG